MQCPTFISATSKAVPNGEHTVFQPHSDSRNQSAPSGRAPRIENGLMIVGNKSINVRALGMSQHNRKPEKVKRYMQTQLALAKEIYSSVEGE